MDAIELARFCLAVNQHRIRPIEKLANLICQFGLLINGDHVLVTEPQIQKPL